MAAMPLGLLAVLFGFYLYGRKDRFVSLAGSLLAVLGLVIFIYGLISVLVPSFFY
ncbi:MAG: hypothetical protein JW984_04600 [Deltaproteobacteria bacterium]|uniref:Uncharacterized protein n=1 Tax=Candidatus Zymogenus saltonus TaxID=2844893 RepID=A0A9D8KE82_9DELT|nr:hypothetical protein [Candidatus Zymogenus saltonus]